MISAVALRTGSIRTALKAKQTQYLVTRFLGTTQVRLAGGPEEIYLYRKPVIKEVIKTEEEKALEIARKLRTWEKAHDIFYGPERDFKNFPHPKRVDKPGKHHLGFIPHSWFLALYPKLGVMGPYTLIWGFILFIHSKEYLVFEHSYYEAAVWPCLLVLVNSKYGPRIGAYLDKVAQENNRELYDEPLANAKKEHTQRIESAEQELWRQEAVPLIFQAKKENVALQLETQYRQRLEQVYSEVKKRLDYQAEVDATRRSFEQKHMVKWIVNNVIKSITPQQEKESIANCIQTLKRMSATPAV